MFNLLHLLKVINPEPVTIDHQACLRARHRRSACRACTDICPDEAISYESGKLEVDASRCSKCSLCAGACPTGAMTILGIEEQSVLAGTALRCSKVGGEGPQVPCLGWLTADHLIGMALQGDGGTLELTCSDCTACPWASGSDLAAAAIQTATAALEAIGKPSAIRVTLVAAGEAAPELVLSRRDLFSLWTTEGKQVAKTLLPEKDVNHAKLPARVPARRTAWVKRADPADVPEVASVMPDGPWKARAVSEACNGCGICAAFCPTGALAQRQDGEDWVLSHQAAACVGCGTCVALCPLKAVGEEPLPAAVMVAGEARDLRRLRARRCTSCRKEYKGDPESVQCPHCRATYNMLKI